MLISPLLLSSPGATPQCGLICLISLSFYLYFVNEFPCDRKSHNEKKACKKASVILIHKYCNYLGAQNSGLPYMGVQHDSRGVH